MSILGWVRAAGELHELCPSNSSTHTTDVGALQENGKYPNANIIVKVLTFCVESPSQNYNSTTTKMLFPEEFTKSLLHLNVIHAVKVSSGIICEPLVNGVFGKTYRSQRKEQTTQSAC